MKDQRGVAFDTFNRNQEQQSIKRVSDVLTDHFFQYLGMVSVCTSSTYSCNSSYACCTVQGANGCCGYSVTVDEWLSQSTVPGIFAASFAVTIIVFFFYFASADTSLPKEEERGSPAWVNYIAPSEESKDSIHDSSGKPSTTPAVATNTKSVP
uniref:Transmembrane protein n=1 Tax=Panagrellus redivivus TaxID=6233 RepID=A0A7E4W1H9_PANRE